MNSLGDVFLFFLSPFLSLILLPHSFPLSLSLSFFFFFNCFFLPNNMKWWRRPLGHRRSVTGRMRHCHLLIVLQIQLSLRKWVYCLKPVPLFRTWFRELDCAMLRRLEKRILVDLPSQEAREAMIHHWLPPVSRSSALELRADLEYSLLSRVSRLGRPPRDPLLGRVISRAVRRLESPRKDPDYPQQPDRPLLHERVSPLPLASIPAERDVMEWK